MRWSVREHPLARTTPRPSGLPLGFWFRRPLGCRVGLAVSTPEYESRASRSGGQSSREQPVDVGSGAGQLGATGHRGRPVGAARIPGTAHHWGRQRDRSPATLAVRVTRGLCGRTGDSLGVRRVHRDDHGCGEGAGARNCRLSQEVPPLDQASYLPSCRTPYLSPFGRQCFGPGIICRRTDRLRCAPLATGARPGDIRRSPSWCAVGLLVRSR
jgi:hypothetical protein